MKKISSDWVSDFLRRMPVYDGYLRTDYTISKLAELDIEVEKVIDLKIETIADAKTVARRLAIFLTRFSEEKS